MREQQPAYDSLEYQRASAEIDKLKAETEELRKNRIVTPANLVAVLVAATSLFTAFTQHQNAKQANINLDAEKDKAQFELTRLQSKLDDTKADFTKAKEDFADFDRQKTKLMEEISALTATSKSLRSANEKLVATATAGNQALAAKATTGEQAGNGQSAIDKLANAKYSIGIYALDSAKGFADIKEWIRAQGYTILQEANLVNRPPWLSIQSTVLYYDAKSENMARRIADNLFKQTGTGFGVARGAGLGVPKGEEQWTFFVHFVP